MRETSIVALYKCPNWGCSLKPRNVPWLEIKPATFQSTGLHSTDQTTDVPLRPDPVLDFNLPSPPPWLLELSNFHLIIFPSKYFSLPYLLCVLIVFCTVCLFTPPHTHTYMHTHVSMHAHRQHFMHNNRNLCLLCSCYIVTE